MSEVLYLREVTFEGPNGVVIGPLSLKLKDTDHLVVCDAFHTGRGDRSGLLDVLFGGKEILSGEIGGSLYGYKVCQPSISESLAKELQVGKGLTALTVVCRGYDLSTDSTYIPRSNAGMARNLMTTYFCKEYQSSLFRSLRPSVSQRVLLCRSLCAEAKIHVLEEPSVDLSLKDTSVFDRTLTGLASLGTPVIEVMGGEASVHSATVVLDILPDGKVKVTRRG